MWTLEENEFEPVASSPLFMQLEVEAFRTHPVSPSRRAKDRQ
jgi:hypothetical protein